MASASVSAGLGSVSSGARQAAAARGTGVGRGGVTLTRRGKRLVAATGVVAAVGIAASLSPDGLWGRSAQPSAPAQAGVQRTVEVQPGDSLWRIAAKELPSVETADAVKAIRALNGPSASHLVPGQKLVLPESGNS